MTDWLLALFRSEENGVRPFDELYALTDSLWERFGCRLGLGTITDDLRKPEPGSYHIYPVYAVFTVLVPCVGDVFHVWNEDSAPL